jgi:hypothetical protein
MEAIALLLDIVDQHRMSLGGVLMREDECRGKWMLEEGLRGVYECLRCINSLLPYGWHISVVRFY